MTSWTCSPSAARYSGRASSSVITVGARSRSPRVSNSGTGSAANPTSRARISGSSTSETLSDMLTM
jgi:hypothetical protein